jgi:hypothetical protein
LSAVEAETAGLDAGLGRYAPADRTHISAAIAGLGAAELGNNLFVLLSRLLGNARRDGAGVAAAGQAGRRASNDSEGNREGEQGLELHPTHSVQGRMARAATVVVQLRFP